MNLRVPAPGWVPGYERGWVRGDLLAGVTVTAYLIPQVMAYAELAGLPAVTGLWAAIGALVVYAVLGSSRQLSVGPESTTALMTAAALGAVTSPTTSPAAMAAALAFVVAGFCLLGWIARLAALADLLSRPVLIGYLAGIAAIMVVSQLGKLLGIEVQGDGFLRELGYAIGHLADADTATVVLGLVTLAAMLLAAAKFPRAPIALLGMLGATVAVWAFNLDDRGVQLVGSIPGGDTDTRTAGRQPRRRPRAAPSGARRRVRRVHRQHPDRKGVRFPARRGVDAKRELLALGAANLGSGLLHGFPVSSSGSRTAIGDAVGGRTQLASLVTVVCTVAALLFARPLLAAFPLAALGAVVVYAATRLVDVGEFVRFARFRRSEFLLAVGTTVAVLVVGVLEGILVAIGLSVLDLLRRSRGPTMRSRDTYPASPACTMCDDYASAQSVAGLLVYRYDSPLFFANAEDFHRRDSGSGHTDEWARAVVRAEHRGDRRGRHHRGGCAREPAPGTHRSRHRRRLGQGQAGAAERARPYRVP